MHSGFLHWFNLRRSPQFINFVQINLFSYYRTHERRPKLDTNVAQLKCNLFHNNWLFYLQLLSLFHFAVLFHSTVRKLYTCLIPFYFLVFSWMLSVVVKEWNSVVFDFIFVHPKSIFNSFLCIQFTWLPGNILSCSKEVIKFLVFFSVLYVELSSFCWSYF